MEVRDEDESVQFWGIKQIYPVDYTDWSLHWRLWERGSRHRKNERGTFTSTKNVSRMRWPHRNTTMTSTVHPPMFFVTRFVVTIKTKRGTG